MANNLNTNPVYIDTFGSDVTVSTDQVVISCVTVVETNNTAARYVTFIDNNANVVLRVPVAQNDMNIWGPIKPFRFTNGFIYDESASTVANNDIILVFKE